MTVVAEELSEYCDLTVHADGIWIGGGSLGLGIVFTGVSMGGKVLTLEDNVRQN